MMYPGSSTRVHGAAGIRCGPGLPPAKYDIGRRYRHLECKVYDEDYDERQLVVHVRTTSTFTPEWLTTKDCS